MSERADKPSSGGDSGQRERFLEAIHEFALSQVGLVSLDEILWNVCRTAIAKLGLVDCVIYLVDPDRDVLVQTAAHGPKNPVAKDILDPITIPVGKGIVGAVARTGRYELVADTRQDPRYIVDDATRLSELSVPIVHQDRVIGVIDSEHPEPGFFTSDHVKMMTTIATLVSTRIDAATTLERLVATIGQLRETEKRLEAQAERLSTAVEQADRFSREKTRFLANMSHEIRTPVTAIVGYADLLASGECTPEERESWSVQVRRHSDHLTGLIEHVLDLSKIEAGVIEPNWETTDPRELIADLMGAMEPLARHQGLTLAVTWGEDIPGAVITDPTRLRQALSNLVTNAIKYTDAGRVDIVVECLRVASSTVRLAFEVQDTGIGLPDGYEDRIFEPFVQGHEGDERRAGAGLGLVIASRFAQLLGGDLTARPRPSGGSVFRIEIRADLAPSVDAEEDLSGESEPEDRLLEGATIYLVEDCTAISVFVTRLLERAGARVLQAADGREGLTGILDRIQRDDAPDLVVLDMAMPVMDGYQVARELRARGVELPVVAMTAFALEQDRQKCLDAGCTSYIAKPISPRSFVRALAQLLREATT